MMKKNNMKKNKYNISNNCFNNNKNRSSVSKKIMHAKVEKAFLLNPCICKRKKKISKGKDISLLLKKNKTRLIKNKNLIQKIIFLILLVVM